jgi:Icc-related predicted phosphoesterase
VAHITATRDGERKLEPVTKKPGIVRVAAVGDIHLGGKGYEAPLQILFGQVSDHADVLALCGDLTDRGDPEEARLMAKALSSVAVPIVAVLGNHDYESGKEREVAKILCDAGVHVLDGEAHEVLGVGFAGIKGFAGGFGRRALGPWGEGLIKQFVREALDEALKLETALSQLRTERRVALLHYSPIAATVVGEPLEIYPYLGSSRLEEPLSRYPVDVVFHGHAHHGTPEGRTMGDVPVYNVSMVLLQENFPDRPAFRVVELPVNRPADDRDEAARATPLRRASDRTNA